MTLSARGGKARAVIFLRKSRLSVLTSALALFVFCGDIVVDSVADAVGEHCISQSSQSDGEHEKAPCAHCSCAVHNGAVVATDSTVKISGESGPSIFFPASDQSVPAALPAAIDHPPQLA